MFQDSLDSLTVCCGVTTLQSIDSADGVSLLLRAHEALIKAKSAPGKNTSGGLF